MTPDGPAALIAQISADRRAIATHLVSARMGPLLDVDLTVQQLKTILLVCSGEATTGGALAEHLHVTASTVSTGVDKLIDADYLSRDECADDRRVRTLAPTSRAVALYEAVIGLRDQSDHALALLREDDLQALARGMRAMLTAVAATTSNVDDPDNSADQPSSVSAGSALALSVSMHEAMTS